MAFSALTARFDGLPDEKSDFGDAKNRVRLCAIFYAFDLVHYNAGLRTPLGRLELGIQHLKFEFTMAFGERYLKDS